MLDIQIVPQQHHAKFLQRGGDRVGPRLTEDYGNIGCRTFKWGLQKLVNLRCITVGQLDDDMIVPPSDGPMFILINWE